MTDADTIIKHWNAGLTATQIGEKIGKTRSAVLGKISRLRASGINLERRAMVGKDGERRYKERARKQKITAQLSFDALFALAPAKPDLLQIEEVIIVKPRGFDLLSLTTFQCRYVIGRHKDTAMYCGEPVHRRSMCREHHARCYYRPKKD